jgi:hypothetical protein
MAIPQTPALREGFAERAVCAISQAANRRPRTLGEV